MVEKQPKSINYHLLTKDLHPEAPRGFSQTLVNLVINKNTTKDRDKSLLIKKNMGPWFFPSQEIDEKELSEGFFETLVVELGEELGFKGMKIIELKPKFIQHAQMFNFDKRVYDDDSAERATRENRPDKGNVYHLTIMHYKGPDELPLDPGEHEASFTEYRWVDNEEALELMGTPNNPLDNFQHALYERVIKTYKTLEDIYMDKNPYQQYLL